MPLTFDQFGKTLVASGLMSADELKALWNALPADARPKQGDGFAKLLVQQGKLNQFQADELLSGRNTPLVMGDYVLVAELGAGGMGKVYKARHRRMERIVALKVMSTAAMQDEAAVKRFQREVKAAARLEHPNIVTAYDSGESGKVKYLVMQFVDGGDLSQLVKQNGPLEIERAIDYVLQAARGLAFAHGEGVVHRDIKPANLLLDKKGVVKILDMGLARIEGGDGLTATEQVMGTVDYMSPEQAANTKTADGRSDIYSLGCTLWFLLTAKKVYDGDTMISRLMSHRTDPLPSLVKARDDIPWSLEQAFHKMIAKSPEERFQSMDEVVAALEPFAPGGGSRSGVGSSIGMGPQSAEMASFLKSIGPAVKPQTKPAPTGTKVDVEATAQFAAAGADTDPKSEILRPLKKATQPQAKGAGKKPPPNKNLLLAAAGGAALLVLLGVWFIFRDKDGNETARVQLPEGGSVTVQQNVPAGTKPAATPSATISFFLPGMTATGAPTFSSTPIPTTTALSALQTRWPLAASKPADMQWLVGLAADVTIRVALPAVNSSIDQTIKTATEIPAGPATIVGVEFRGDSARLTDADLARLCGFVDLESLSFDNDGNRSGPPREITGQGWSKLASLKHLRSLKLEGCRQVTVLPDFMASLTALESLDLQYPDAAEWARAAAAAPALKRINAYRTQLGDDGLAHLEKRTSLQQIDLRDSRVTQAAVDRFAAAVPQCRITWGADKNPTVIEPRVPPPSTATLVAAPPPGDYVLEFTGFGHTDGGAWVDAPSLMLSETGPLTLEARVWRLGHNEGYVLGTENIGIRLFGGQWAAVASPAKTKTFPSEIRRWYHLAAVRTDGELRMYVDGTRIDTQPLPPRTGPQPPPRSLPLKIGGNSANLRLDEIRISKTARYDPHFTPPTKHVSDADTLALYHCDDGAGDVLKDASGNGHDGKITKPSWVLPDGSPISTTMFTAPATTPVAAPPVANGVVYLDELTEKSYFGLKTLAKPGRNPNDVAEPSKVFPGAPLVHALHVHPEDPRYDKHKDAAVALPSHKNTSRLVYDLDGKYALFQSGFRSRTGSSNLQAEVWGDGRRLWESGAPIAQHPAGTTAEVDVRGVRELTLFIWCEEGKTHVLLTDPRLTPVAATAPAAASPAGVVYLDDLQELESVVGYMALGKHGTKGKTSFSWRGSPVAHSLWMRPKSNHVSFVRYRLDGQYARFESDTGQVPEINAPPTSPMTFRVLGDGRELWKSKPIAAKDDFDVVSIDVRGVQELRLETSCAGGEHNCEATWYNPRLTPVAASGPQPLAPSPSQPAIPAEALTFNGHRYLLVDSPGTWDEAKAKAEAIGGHLITINTQEELDWVRENLWKKRPSLERVGSAEARIHLGAFQKAKDEPWQWVTGEPWDPGFWLGKNGPNTQARPVSVSWMNDNNWDDTIWAQPHRYLVVEWDTLGPELSSKVVAPPPVATTRPQSVAPPPAVFPFDAAAAVKHQEAWAQYLGVPVEFTNGVGMKFRLIPPGEFQMGLGPELTDDELTRIIKPLKGLGVSLPMARPARPVRITRPFYLEVEEVTVGLYRDIVWQLRPVMDQNLDKPLPNHVSWPDAIAFCNKLSEREGKRPAYRIEGEQVTPIDDADGYRLPTEAQWEFACRAGTDTLWHFGHDGAGTNFMEKFALPNPFGLLGLYGGVSEWCWDACDQAKNYSSSLLAVRDDPRQDAGSLRINRGGAQYAGGGSDRTVINSFARGFGHGGPYDASLNRFHGLGRVMLPIAPPPAAASGTK